MRTRRFGDTDLEASEIGFGTWALGSSWWGDVSEADGERLLGEALDLGITFYPKYRLFVMIAAALLVLGAWLFLEKTRYGAIMRAGIEDKEMVSLLGIDIHRLFTVAFALGSSLAGIAGALTAPIRGLNPWRSLRSLEGH